MKRFGKLFGVLLGGALSVNLLFGMTGMEATAAGNTRYEAENGAVCDSSGAKKIHTGTTNASGGQSATLYRGNSIVFHVNAEADGSYQAVLNYAGACNPSGDTITSIPVSVSTNGGTAAKYLLDYPGYYNTFMQFSFEIALKKGSNTIRIENVSTNSTLFTNVDYLDLTLKAENTGYPAAEGRHEAEQAFAYVQGSASSPYSLQYSANYSGGCAVGNLNCWPEDGRSYFEMKVNAKQAGSYRMTIGYAGGEAGHPCNIDVNVNNSGWKSVYAGNITAWDNVTTVETTVELVEGVNTICVTGASNIWYEGMGWEWLNMDYIELTRDQSSANVRYSGAELMERNLVSFRGRNMVNGEAVTFDYTASGFEFDYNGWGDVVANITTTANEKFAIDVDGNVRYVDFNNKTGDLALATGLANGSHTIKLYKTQEAMTGLAQLNSLSSSTGTLSPKTYNYRFLVIGASTTCGNQMDPASGAENGYLAFPSRVGRAFGATWQQISVSGRGVSQGTLGESGWAFSQDRQLAKLFTYQSWFRDQSVKYDTTSYVPDVIITNFNNDFSASALQQGYSADQVFEYMMSFIGQLRSSYPNAYILMTYGNYPNFDNDGVYTNYQIIEKYKNAVNNYLAATGDGNIEFLTFPDLVNGKSNHPTAEEHSYLAELVSERISAHFGVTNPLPRTHFEIETGTLVNAGNTGKATQITTWASQFSNNCYVEGMNQNLGNASIAGDGSNAKYVDCVIHVPTSGNYSLELLYATGGAPDIYLKVNNGNWEKKSLPATGGWATVKTASLGSVYLNAGDNRVRITGAVNSSYICLDRLDVHTN